MTPELEERNPRPGFSIYDLWARDIERQEDDGTAKFRLQPALVRLTGGQTGDGARRLLGALEEGELLADAAERARIEAFLRAPEDQDRENAFFQIYWLDAEDGRIEKDFAEVFEIVERARPVRARQRARAGTDALPAPPARPPKGPIVAVIDDGIGFLNARFWRKGGGKTRVHAVWLQSFQTVPAPPFGGFYTFAGQILFRHEIDALIGAEEDWVYRMVNGGVVPLGAHRSLEFSFTHGTHVMDVAGGADPVAGDPMSDLPLIAVQLPSDAVDNTAGWQLEHWIVAGVRWVLWEAERAFAKNPVIINISFATFAGPKDGTKRIEAKVDRLLRTWQARTGRCARAVYAFGNSYRDRQLARVPVTAADETVMLRVQPDNRAAAYVEFRPESQADMARFALTLRLPEPGAAPVALPPLPPNAGVVLVNADGAAVAWFVHVEGWVTVPGIVTPSYYLLAIAPTDEGAGTSAAPAGEWPMTLSSRDGVAFDCRVEVQRGDTPIGYPRHGRQCYLDHPAAYEWEVGTADYGLPAPPIVRDGTHSSYVTSPAAAAGAVAPVSVRVGAALYDAFDAAALHGPSSYSAEGSVHTVPGPHLSALADMGHGLTGVVASGTATGSARTLDGTSVAAGQVTRAIATGWAAAGCKPLKSPADFDGWINALVAQFGAPGDPALVARQGAGVLTRPGGGRERRERA